jgi:glucokinase
MIAIGIDIGGTFVKFFAVNEKKKIIKKDKVPTYTTLTANAFLTQIADIVNDWKAEFKSQKVVLGAGLPGDTDHVKGVLRWAPNIPWHNLKVKEVLTKKTGCKCFVSNDANMAAWGVYELELGAKYTDLIIVTMGTGIGGGVIINGDLYQGATGSAGELGHMKIDFAPDAPLCGCGQRGCLEAFAGTKGIRREVEAAAVCYPKSILAELLKTQDFSVNLLSIAAERGDEIAAKLWCDIGTHLGRGIANMVLFLNPQAVVLAGGVSRGAKHFMHCVEDVFKEQSVKTPFKKLKVLLSEEGNIGGVGAALYALSKTDEK